MLTSVFMLVLVAAPVVVRADDCLCQAALQGAVCGSDGNTYTSKCALECARTSTTDLLMAHVGPCPSAAAPSQNLDKLAHCNIACMTDFNRCANKCSDDGCLRDCARSHLAQCNCNCASLIPTLAVRGHTSQAGRVLEAWRRAADANLTAVNVRATLLASGDAASEYQKIVSCYLRYFQTFNNCASRCGTGAAADEACIFKCARPAFSGVCACASSEPSGGSGDIDGYAQCSNQCVRQNQPCMNSCQDYSCIKRCVQNVVSCTCGCQSYLVTGQQRSSSESATKLESDRITLPAPLLALIRGDKEDAAKIIQCYNDHAPQMGVCTNTCSNDPGCITKCLLSVLSDLCEKCGAEGPVTPATAATTDRTLPPPATTTPDIFTMCTSMCGKDLTYCDIEICEKRGGGSVNCYDQCLDLLSVDVAKCGCGCRQYVDSYNPYGSPAARHPLSTLSGRAAPKAGPDSSAKVCLIKAGDYMISACSPKCAKQENSSAQNACEKECMKEWVDAVCKCTDSGAKNQAVTKPALVLVLLMLFRCVHA